MEKIIITISILLATLIISVFLVRWMIKKQNKRRQELQEKQSDYDWGIEMVSNGYRVKHKTSEKYLSFSGLLVTFVDMAMIYETELEAREQLESYYLSLQPGKMLP